MNDQDETTAELSARIAQLEREIAELRGSLPRHSARAEHILRLEDLEEELDAIRVTLSRHAGAVRPSEGAGGPPPHPALPSTDQSRAGVPGEASPGSP